MRKITLSLFALMVCVAAYCGVPQAISYQAVALDVSGQPVKSRTVALRLSIIATNPSGTVDYQERQTPTTDNSGIFSIEIGNGTVLSGTFAGINWSTGVYYLKTEIDTNGGTSYVTVGTVQFYSVPYALYSASSASANLSSPDFPDGLNSITPVMLNGSFTYTVPTGQTLYITQVTSNNSSSTCSLYGVNIEGVFVSSSPVPGSGLSSTGTTAANSYVMDNPVIVPQGVSVISSSCATSLIGFTAPKNYSWVLFDLSTGNYTVPAGQVLIIKNMISGTGANWNGTYSIGGLTTTFGPNISLADQGSTITATGLSGSLLMMGYLKPR